MDLSQTLQGAGGIGGLITSVDTNTNKMYYYLSDANGNVTQLIDSIDGSLTAHYEYDPYGNLLAKTGSYADTNPYRFSSKHFDQETGLGFWGYRYYSPSLGRWINRDPIEEEGGINIYDFASNNPINAIDPLGLLWAHVDHIPEIAYKRARTGDDIAAKRLTWQLWEAECGDTIYSLAEEVGLAFQDWPRWLSLEKAAPGSHALPALIQPGDIYKVKRFAALVGIAVPNANIYVEGFGSKFWTVANDRGYYGVVFLRPKLGYTISNPFYEYGDHNEYGNEMGKLFKKYYFIFDYGEVKTVNFPINTPSILKH